jgi:hypothetical protein
MHMPDQSDTVWAVKGRNSPLLFDADIRSTRSLGTRSVILSCALIFSTIHHLILDVYKKNDAVLIIYSKSFSNSLAVCFESPNVSMVRRASPK